MSRNAVPAEMYIKVLWQINKIIESETDTAKQFKRIFKEMSNVVPFGLLSLFVLKRDNRLKRVFAMGKPRSVVEAVNFNLGKGGTWHAGKHGRPYIIQNRKTEIEQLNSFLAVPIIYRKNIIGVISLGIYTGYNYKKRDIILVKIISSALINLLIFLQQFADSSK